MFISSLYVLVLFHQNLFTELSKSSALCLPAPFIIIDENTPQNVPLLLNFFSQFPSASRPPPDKSAAAHGILKGYDP